MRSTARLKCSVAFASSLMASGCVDDHVTDHTELPSFTLDTVRLALPVDSIVEDEPMMAMARAMPSTFGGFWFDADGTVVIGLTEVREFARAATLVRPWLGPDRDAAMRPQTVQYPFLILAAYRTKLSGRFFREQGTVGIGVSESENRITLYVASTQAEDRVRGLMSELDIPAEVAVFRITEVPRDAILLTNAQPRGLIEAGWRVVNSDGFGCTAGFTAQSGTTTGFVTNSHCTTSPTTLTGDSLRQPSSIGYLWGRETIDPSTYTCLYFGYPTPCRASDSAFFEALRDLHFARIARTTDRQVCDNCYAGLTVDTANPIRISHRADHTFEGQMLEKIGMTSGWTAGTVRDTCTDYITTGGWVKRCSDRADFSMKSGDSGSPVFRLTISGTATLAGIAFASFPSPFEGALLSDLHQIETDLGPLNVHDPIAYAAIEGAAVVPPSAYCDWYGYVEGLPPFTYEWRRDGVVVSTAQSYATSDTGPSSFTLSFKVTDSRADTDIAYLNVTVDPNDHGFICQP